MKVTVDPIDVARKLTVYGVLVGSVFDLRYLALKCDSRALSLPRLSVDHLKVKLSENYRLEQVRWKGNRLKEADVKYAAKSVRVPIELFKLFEEKLKDPSADNDVQKFIDEHCSRFLNKSFRAENLAKNETEGDVDAVQNERPCPKPSVCMISTAEKCEKALRQIQQYVLPLK